MGAISASSTLAEIRAEYVATASYEEDGDVAKAQRFVTACRALLVMLPANAMHNNMAQAGFNIEQIAAQIKTAQQFIARSSASSAQVRQVDFTDFRS